MVVRLTQKAHGLGKLTVMNRAGKGQALHSEATNLETLRTGELTGPYVKEILEQSMTNVANMSLNGYSQVQAESNGE